VSPGEKNKEGLAIHSQRVNGYVCNKKPGVLKIEDPGFWSGEAALAPACGARASETRACRVRLSAYRPNLQKRFNCQAMHIGQTDIAVSGFYHGF